MYAGQLGLAGLADRLGYDSLWAVEHHFDDYAMCPDNVVLLANVAGRTKRLKLGTATRPGTGRPPRATWASPGLRSTGRSSGSGSGRPRCAGRGRAGTAVSETSGKHR
jgi:hypothetical protein